VYTPLKSNKPSSTFFFHLPSSSSLLFSSIFFSPLLPPINTTNDSHHTSLEKQSREVDTDKKGENKEANLKEGVERKPTKKLY
jgi:hypothetical protein